MSPFSPHPVVSLRVEELNASTSPSSNDCTVLGENLTDSLQSGSRDFFAGAISLFFMLYISVPVTLVSLIVVPSTVYFSYKYGQWVRKAGRVAQENVGEMTKVGLSLFPFHSPPAAQLRKDWIMTGCRGEACYRPHHRGVQRPGTGEQVFF